MLNHLSQRFTKVWLLVLLTATLLGVQLLQYSPLHDHAREVADCALCHLQPLNDDVAIDHSVPTPVLIALALVIVDFIAAPRTAFHSPYQGRAPPHPSH